MVTLLSLPQELRDYILLYSMFSPIKAPTTFDKDEPGEYAEADDLDHISRIGSRGIYSTKQPQNIQSSLLLTCRQLHDETRIILERYNKQHGIHYSLDVILLQEEELACSWTSIPSPRRNVDSLEVKFRIHGVAKGRNGFADNNGSTGSTVWRLYSLLERFLRCGASTPNSRTCDRGLKLRNLKITIEAPDLKAPANAGYTIASDEVSPDRISEHRAGALEGEDTHPQPGLIHPLSLAKFMYTWMAGLLRMTDPAYAIPGAPLQKYGGMLMERLESVTYCAEGCDSKTFEIDVAEVTGKKRREEQQQQQSRGIVAHVPAFEAL